MKILLLVSSMTSGGAQRVASTLANAWGSRGDKVILMPTFSGRGECFYDLSPEVQLVYLSDLTVGAEQRQAGYVSRLCVLRRFMMSERPNVIISFLPNVNVSALVASFGLGIPVIICERTDPFVRRMPLLWRFACRLIYPLADALMVQTQAVAGKYIRSAWWLKRLRVIANPIPEQILSIQRHSGVRMTKRLLSVGTLQDGKQFDMLIRVFFNLSKRHTNWFLRIVGEGPLRANLQRQIVNLDLQGRVELPGRSADIGTELAESDAFVLTSRYEGFPNALLEAMAVGLPCVSFDCPSGPREMSCDGQFALLVPLDNEPALEQAIEKLMVDENLRYLLGNRARASVGERFALKRVLSQWDSLFEETGVQS